MKAYRPGTPRPQQPCSTVGEHEVWVDLAPSVQGSKQEIIGSVPCLDRVVVRLPQPQATPDRVPAEATVLEALRSHAVPAALAAPGTAAEPAGGSNADNVEEFIRVAARTVVDMVGEYVLPAQRNHD